MDSVDRQHLESLLGQALRGDACAWNDLFREVRNYLHAEVRKVLGPDVRGPLEHSALVQSTLRRAWEHLGTLFPDGTGEADLGRFLAWIATIARNRSRDELRRRARERVEAVGSAIEGFAGWPTADRGPARDRIAVELAAALARLPDRKRQVVELFWFEGLSDAAIGERLGCSPGAVKVLRFRALKQLQTPKLRLLLEDVHDS